MRNTHDEKSLDSCLKHLIEKDNAVALQALQKAVL